MKMNEDQPFLRKSYRAVYRDVNRTMTFSLNYSFRNRTCTYLYTPHNSYHPRQGEWLTEQGRQRHVNTPKKTGGLRSWSEPPLPPTYRRTYTVPTSTTRVDNHALYWIGRRKGVKYIKPFLDVSLSSFFIVLCFSRPMIIQLDLFKIREKMLVQVIIKF